MQISLDFLNAIEQDDHKAASLAEEEFVKIKRGLKLANINFSGARFMIVDHQSEYSYADRIHRNLKLVRAIRDEKKALDYLDAYTDLAIKRLILEMNEEEGGNWFAEDVGPHYRCVTKRNTEHSSRLAVRLAKVTSGNGFDYVYCETAAIVVDPDRPVGKALVSQVGDEWFWKRYFFNLGATEGYSL